MGTRSRGMTRSSLPQPSSSRPSCGVNWLLRARQRVICRARSARKLKLMQTSPSRILPSGSPRSSVSDERNDELVGDAAVVRVLHALHRIGIAATLGVAEDHRVESFLLALPLLVAIHGIVAAADGGDLADAVLAHLLLQLLDVARAVGGQRVAAVHEAVHEHALHAVLLGHAQERVEVVLVRVHAAVREQTEEVQAAVAGARLASWLRAAPGWCRTRRSRSSDRSW